jgi:hypothetical protein
MFPYSPDTIAIPKKGTNHPMKNGMTRLLKRLFLLDRLSRQENVEVFRIRRSSWGVDGYSEDQILRATYDMGKLAISGWTLMTQPSHETTNRDRKHHPKNGLGHSRPCGH